MAEKNTFTGQCLCGQVKLTLAKRPDTFTACHCGQCRKWGSGPLLSMHAKEGFEIAGEDHVQLYASSAWAERAFCKLCGSSLYYRLTANGARFVSLGLFDNVDDVKFHEQIFIDAKPAAYHFAEETSTLTEAELWAKYGPAQP